MQASSSGINEKSLVVYLDTTYCEPQYDFPEQAKSVRDHLNTNIYGANPIMINKLYVWCVLLHAV